MEHRSLHRTESGEIVEVARQWDPLHIEAGYHEQEWVGIPTADHELLGTYDCVHGGVEQQVTVRFLASGLTGPEFELEWTDGHKVTVVDADTALQYLALDGAVELVPDEPA